jgi:predicted nucleic acid-binding protein
MLVLDATVLINLGGVRALWILRDSVDAEIVVVDEVASEILREPAITDLRMAIEDHWIRRHHLVTDDELALFARLRQRYPHLGVGETASLAVCIANDWVFASDDLTARRVATAETAPTPVGMSGTITVLLNAVERSVLDWTTAENLYARMLDRGYRAPFSRLSDALQRG